jgi:hypothetical protein
MPARGLADCIPTEFHSVGAITKSGGGILVKQAVNRGRHV